MIIDDELSILYFVLRDDGRLFELATSSMCDFEGRAQSVGPVGTVFAARKNVRGEQLSSEWGDRSYAPITLVIMIAKPIKTTLLVHELESWPRICSGEKKDV